MFFKKKLITVGDSFTDDYVKCCKENLFLLEKKPYLKNIKPFKIWPELLSEKLNLKLINLGQCGRGNEYIFNKAIDATLEHKDIGLMVVLWSEIQRFDFKIEDYNFTSNLANHTGHTIKIEEDIKTIFNENKIYDLNYALNKFFRLSYALQTICENNNIKLIQSFGTHVGAYFDDKQVKYELCKYIINHKILYKLKNFIGEPFINSIGGYTLKDLLHKDRLYILDDEDTHPNEEGHQLFYKIIHDYYLKNIKK